MTMTIRRFCSRLLNRIVVTFTLMGIILPGLFLGGCSEVTSPISEKKEIKIGVCVYDEYDTFVASITKNMKDWCRKKERETGIKITIDVESSMGSQMTQNDQVEKFIARDYDAVCVNLVDRTDATLIIDKAMSSDTPVVFFNRELVEEDLDRWDKLYYVGAIAEQSGRLQAQIILSDLYDKTKFDQVDVNHNGTIQYVILEGEAGHQDALVRTQVVTDELLGAGISLEKLGDEYANWSKDVAKSKMKSLMDRYPFQIELVIANDDDMALGALEALAEGDYPTTPFVYGINGTEEALEAIRTMKLNGSVYNDSVGQAEKIVDICYALAMGEELPNNVELSFGKYVFLPYSKITYDNVQDYLHKGK